jgi:antitoxin MazE
MKVKVSKWGNSLAVRLPRGAIEAVGAKEGSELDLTVERNGLYLRQPRQTSAELLADMVAEMKRLGPENAPETVDWGPDRGSEIIDDEYSRGEITLEDLLGSKSAGKHGASARTDRRR